MVEVDLKGDGLTGGEGQRDVLGVLVERVVDDGPRGDHRLLLLAGGVADHPIGHPPHRRRHDVRDTEILGLAVDGHVHRAPLVGAGRAATIEEEREIGGGHRVLEHHAADVVELDGLERAVARREHQRAPPAVLEGPGVDAHDLAAHRALGARARSHRAHRGPSSPHRRDQAEERLVVGQVEALLVERGLGALGLLERDGARRGVARFDPDRERLEHVVHLVLGEREAERSFGRPAPLHVGDAVLEEDHALDGGNHRPRGYARPCRVDSAEAWSVTRIGRRRSPRRR
jgi:hypothetical protein